jgi:hypothetical protein
VQTHRVGVCRGPYPPAFVRAWRAWDARNTSENDFIGGLPPHQLYAVFAMANCGRDLESYALAGWDQVRSMLLQVGALARARARARVCVCVCVCVCKGAPARGEGDTLRSGLLSAPPLASTPAPRHAIP